MNFGSIQNELQLLINTLLNLGAVLLIFISCVFTFALIAVGVHYFLKLLSKSSLAKENKLYLNSNHDYANFILKWTHVLVEKAIFLRVDAYKNNPRGNFIWIISFLRVSFYYILLISIYTYFYSIECFINIFETNSYYFIVIIATFFTLVNTVYNSIKQTFKSKWEYLANLYNITLKNIENENLYNLHENTLAIDIIVSMMWGHRSFDSIAYAEVLTALDYFKEADSSFYDDYITKFNESDLTESNAIKILEKYQLVLLNKIKEDKWK